MILPPAQAPGITEDARIRARTNSFPIAREAIIFDASAIVLDEIAPGLSLDRFPAESCRKFRPLIRNGNPVSG